MKKKMMIKRLYIAIALVALNIMPMQAQTHAHSAAQKWKGFDISEILEAGATADGKKFYLYNVGTGRFVIDGGDWGMEARLFYEDFGRCMEIKKVSGQDRYYIQPGIQEKGTNNKRNLICNVPGVSRTGTWKSSRTSNNGGFSITTILDGDDSYKNWIVERVETDPSSEFHTYRMYQKFNNNKTYQGVTNPTFRYGAVYGEWCSDGTTTFDDGSENKKGNGYYVHIDDDRSCWTTAGQANNTEMSPYGNQTKVTLDNGDQVTIDELYQWRFISEEEFIDVLNAQTVGINPSISSLVPDRDFTRNSQVFFPNWHVTPATTTPVTGEGRCGWTFGNCAYRTAQQKYYPDEAWNAPVMLKKVWDNRGNAKYGFMSFEGIGTAEVTFKLPKAGWYQVEANAISFGPDDYSATMFAYEGGVDFTSISKKPSHGFGEVTLIQVNDPYNLDGQYNDVTFSLDKNGKPVGKNNSQLNLSIGKILTIHGDDYLHKFWVYIDPTKYDQGGDYKNLTLGVKKDYATKSGAQTQAGDETKYYYDKDWVVIDDIRISYMGLAPVFLYEDKESLDYLVYEAGKEDERPAASPDFHYEGAVSLVRSLKKDMWNTLSLPIPLTGEQVRSAFGEQCELLKLNSIGGLSHNECVIDFETVNLKNEDALAQVIEPGTLYMLKPTADPVLGENPYNTTGNANAIIEYYSLGRNFFSVNPADAEEGSEYTHYVMNPSTIYVENDFPSWDGEESKIGGNNDGKSFVSYVRTPSYSKFRVDSNGDVILQSKTGYNLGIVNNTYAPKGSYVMSNDKMYEINRDTPLKGFRGWIKLTHSIFADPTQAAQGAKFAVNGIIDGEAPIATSIDQHLAQPVNVRAIAGVYDLMGRKVSDTIENLPKGLYIVSGKKLLVK